MLHLLSFRRRLMTTLLLGLLVACQAAQLPPTATPTEHATLAAAEPATAAPPTPAASPTLVPAIITHTPTQTATAVPTATPAPTLTPAPIGPGGFPYPLKTAQLQFGVATHLFYVNRTLPLRRARRRLRLGAPADPLERPGRAAWPLRLGRARPDRQCGQRDGLNLLISIVRSPSFYTANGGDGMPKDPKDLGNFVAALAEALPGQGPGDRDLERAEPGGRERRAMSPPTMPATMSSC